MAFLFVCSVPAIERELIRAALALLSALNLDGHNAWHQSGTYQPKNESFTLTMQMGGGKAFDDAPELSDTDTTSWNSCYKNRKHPSAVGNIPHRPTSLVLNTSEGWTW